MMCAQVENIQASKRSFFPPNRTRIHLRTARRSAGLTLLEVIVVVFLIALAFGIGVPSFNTLTHARLKKSSTQMAATIRYLYNQAALKGLCMRMVFDLRNDTFHVEASTDGECLVDDTRVDAATAKRKEEDQKRKDKLEKKSSTQGSTIGGWSGEKPISLKHKKTVFAAYNDYLVKPRKLPSGVRFHGVFTTHQKDVYSRKSGPNKAYLHCFPLGRCERGMIYLEDKSGTVLSLEIKPLTGRVRIHNKKISLSDRFKDRKKGADDDF